MRYFIVAAALMLGACKSAPESGPVAKSDPPARADAMLDDQGAASIDGNVIRRESILESERWAQSFQKAEVDNAAATRLAEVEPGAVVTIWLGTWCGDSVREVTRFWKALDQAGDVSFHVEMRSVERGFTTRYPELEAVPTFVVTRDGEEIGRVVETAVDGIENDVLAILNGEKSGKISATR